MFDLYADWCMPCRVLSPVLEKIAVEMKSSVSFYKINIDKSPDIASVFQVSGIPFVVFIKDKKVVQALLGVQPEAAYRRAIMEHGTDSSQERKDQPAAIDDIRTNAAATVAEKNSRQRPTHGRG